MKLAILAAALLAPTMAFGQSNCGPRESFVEFSENEKNARVVVSGETSSGFLMEIWQAENGAWVLAVTHTNGTLCVFFNGTGLEVGGIGVPA